MITQTYFDHEDMFAIEPLYPDREQEARLAVLFNAPVSTTITIWNAETPVAIVGVITPWTGVSQVYGLFGSGIEKCLKAVIQEIRLILEIYGSTNEIRKFYSLVDADEEKHCRFTEILGFKEEYKMVEAGHKGQDLIGYSKEV